MSDMRTELVMPAPSNSCVVVVWQQLSSVMKKENEQQRSEDRVPVVSFFL